MRAPIRALIFLSALLPAAALGQTVEQTQVALEALYEAAINGAPSYSSDKRTADRNLDTVQDYIARLERDLERERELVNLATKALNKLQNMVYDRIPMRTRLKYCLLKVSEIVELKPRQIPSRCLKEWEQ